VAKHCSAVMAVTGRAGKVARTYRGISKAAVGEARRHAAFSDRQAGSAGSVGQTLEPRLEVEIAAGTVSRYKRVGLLAPAAASIHEPLS